MFGVCRLTLSESEQAEVAALTTTEYAFTWLLGAPSYTQLAGTPLARYRPEKARIDTLSRFSEL